ncbi:MAG: DUF2283 domain-containing protein [Planctomycetota bacterium]
MTLTYDLRHNIAYIRLRESVEQVETIRVSDEMNVDLAPDGTIYGIELLNANQQLGSGELLVLNETSGARSSVKLPI